MHTKNTLVQYIQANYGADVITLAAWDNQFEQAEGAAAVITSRRIYKCIPSTLSGQKSDSADSTAIKFFAKLHRSGSFIISTISITLNFENAPPPKKKNFDSKNRQH